MYNHELFLIVVPLLHSVFCRCCHLFNRFCNSHLLASGNTLQGRCQAQSGFDETVKGRLAPVGRKTGEEQGVSANGGGNDARDFESKQLCPSSNCETNLHVCSSLRSSFSCTGRTRCFIPCVDDQFEGIEGF